MSDKNITELEWKKFSKGKGFKDAAFVKALASLETGKTPEAKLSALAEIEKQADVLRKANKADKELGSYLDDAEKAAAKERKLQEAEAKKAAAQSSSDEEEDSPALLTTKMIPLLRQVKKGEAMQTMVAITGKEVAVLISRKPIGPPKRKLLNDYLGVSGGVKYAVGQVVWEENANTFVLSTQAGGLAKKIKAALLKQTEQRVKVRVRGEDPNDIDDDGEPSPEQEAGETQGSESGNEVKAEIPPAPPLPNAGEQPAPEQQSQEPTVDEGAAFNARLAALMPKVKEAITAGGPNATDVKLKVSEAGVFARKKEFGPAHALLDEAETLMQGGGQAQAPQQQGEDPSAAFNARLAALMPQVKAAIVAAGPSAQDIKLKVSEAGVFARKKEFEQANALLDEAEALIAQGGEGQEDEAEEPSEQQRYEQERERIEPLYLAGLKSNPAEATRLRAVFNYAGEQANALQWGKALNALYQVEKLLGGTDGSGPEKATGTGYKGIVAYRKTLLDLRAAVAKVEGQISALVKAIPSQMPDEADLAEELAEDLRESNEALQDLVDEAMGTAENEDTPITRALSSRLDELIAEVASNEVIQHVDKNPFGVSMSVQATLGDALKAVRAALPVPN